MANSNIQRPRGTTDRLPVESPAWEQVYQTFARECRLRGYQPISTPTFEATELFDKGTGDTTDIVQKEMYTFEDRGGSSMTLRPEGTPSVVRAYLQNGMHALPQPVKLFYVAPIFRYDRPQAGRLREHHQIGAEALGDPSPVVDAEVIDLLWSTLLAVGVDDLSLRLNSLGDPDTRPEYRNALVSYFRPYAETMCSDCQARLTQNPLRLLDCKKPYCEQVSANAPRSVDYLDDPAREHFHTLCQLLDATMISYTVDHRLVRGLDYYNRTVFEIVPPEVGAQSTVGGGGRYDYLAEALGGTHVAGVGFGSGIERILMRRRHLGLKDPPPPKPDACIMPLVEAALSPSAILAAKLRAAGISTEIGYAPSSPRAQLRRANALGARVALIIGEREVSSGQVSVKPLDGGQQFEVSIGSAVETMQTLLVDPSPVGTE